MKFRFNLRGLALPAGLIVIALPASALADVSLAPFFSDGAVLQRDSTAPVWGRAAPGEAVTAALNGQTISTAAGPDGNWRAAFQGLAAGGPFTMTVKGASNSITVPNVLVGDVWLCSGQSNMGLRMIDIADVAKDDIAAANDPLLHTFNVPLLETDTPAKFPTADKWEAADPDTVKNDSAVAYYFAKTLREQVKVPIGIIHDSFGGTSIEGWMRMEVFNTLGLGPTMQARVQQWQTGDATSQTFLSALNQWEAGMGRQDPGNKGHDEGWADPKTSVNDWTGSITPGNWTPLGLAHGGIVWIRKAVNISAEFAGKDLTMNLGNLQNAGREFGNVLGTVYFNNQEVGSIGHTLRHVFSKPDDQLVNVPGTLVQTGTNVVAVRIFTQEEKSPSFGGGTSLLGPALRGTFGSSWMAKVEEAFPPAPADADSTRPKVPSVPTLTQVPCYFFNHILSPWIGYGIKGAVWYQGEANSYTPQGYATYLPAMIADWRGLWGQGNFPFYIVQLANVNAPPTDPNAKSGYAEIREAQLQTWQKVPDTGLAVTIDLGEANNVHYHNKKPAGQRVALIAQARVYGRKIEFSGPVFDSMTVEGSAMRLKFTHLGGGLVAKGGPLKQFAIAGADQNFVGADAVIDGDAVVVSSKDVAAPAAVRYAWADNPAGCNLYNQADLPASPFRTDDWPLAKR